MSESEWFYVEPYVHIATMGTSVALYNTLNGSVIEADYPPIVRLVERLSAATNLRVVALTNREVADVHVTDFVQRTRETFVGDVLAQRYSRGRPIELMPILHMQDGTLEESTETFACSGQDVMTYLSEVTLYVNSSCDRSCPTCRQAYRQFLACTSNVSASHELDIELIGKLVAESQGSGLARVNIVGGDLFQYSMFGPLIELMSKVHVLKTYVTHYGNLLRRDESVRLIAADKDAEMRILVDFPLDEESLGQAVALLSNNGIRFGIDCILQDASELPIAEQVAADMRGHVVSFKACYNGANTAFLEEALFLSKDDILDAKPALREILARRELNPLAFGRLVVLCDGAVCAGVNATPHGHLGRDSLYDIVYSALASGTAWRAPRTSAGACNTCMYNLLCPPRTDYEAALGQSDLCHIRATRSTPIGMG